SRWWCPRTAARRWRSSGPSTSRVRPTSPKRDAHPRAASTGRGSEARAGLVEPIFCPTAGGAMIPTTLDDVTPAWLSEALGEPVAAASLATIAQGEGFMGQLARVRLSYGADGSSGAPPSLVIKLPTTQPGNRAVGEMMRLWEREHRFYDEVAH